MDWILIVALILTFILIKKDVNIGIIMAINSVWLALAAGMTWLNWGSFFLTGILSKKTIELLVLLVLIMTVENILRNSGMISLIADSLKRLIRSRFLVSVSMPVVLGLLPSPGGARFSCPLVEEIVGDGMEAKNKAFLNYWFRHVWVDGFILYPGIILASQLVGVSVLKFLVHLLVFITVTFFAGMLMLNKTWNRSVEKEQVNSTGAGMDLLKGIFPIFFIVGMYMVLLSFTKWALLIAAMLTVILLFIYKKYTWEMILKTSKEAFNLKYLMIICGVMGFGEVLNQSGYVEVMIGQIIEHKIPKELLFVALPFFAGAFSGMTISFVSLTFPLLVPLGIDKNIWYAVCAYAAGFVGIMITPLHLCYIMSCDFFKVKFSLIFKKVLLASLMVMVTIISCLVLTTF